VLAGPTVACTLHFALHRQAVGCIDACEAVIVGHSQPTVAKIALASSTARQPVELLTDDIWLGAMAPKRWARRAVTRNTIKRQIYTVCSEFEHLFPKAAWLVRLRRGFDRNDFPSATSDALKSNVRMEVLALFESGWKAP
jgi:ribonuclease P protein component